MTKRAALMLLVVAAASVCPARAEDNPACVKYEDPLAYNACLASHGPKATGVTTNPRPAPQPHAAQVQAERGRPHPTRSAHGWRRASRGGGRIHMEFVVE